MNVVFFFYENVINLILWMYAWIQYFLRSRMEATKKHPHGFKCKQHSTIIISVLLTSVFGALFKHSKRRN